MRTSLAQLQALWQRMGLPSEVEAWHQRLLSAYAEPQRAYHTLQHLEECLEALAEVKAVHRLAAPDAVETALWFHDAVYDPQSTGNEEASAHLAQAALEGHALTTEVLRLIRLTQTHQPQGGADDAWMIDIDLAIFAQPEARVLEYEQQIRREYAWVPEALYREKRKEILAAFLSRSRIYLTDWFYQRHEQTARQHLALLIHSL